MVPTAYAMSHGKIYSRKSGKHSIQMYSRGSLYVVKYGSESWGYLSYDAALKQVTYLLFTTGDIHDGRQRQDTPVRRLSVSP